MKLATFSKLAPTFYKSGKSMYLRSAPGRGKTSVILAAVPAIAEETGLSIGISIISGPTLSLGDTMGYGIAKHHDDGSADMVFTRPFFFRTAEGKLLDEYDGGILFIDEVDKADVDVKKILGEMALSGRCGVHRLPPGWVVWMAGNRREDRSGSTKELDHLITRRFEFDVTDDLAGWEVWAWQNNVHHTVISFAAQNPHIVFPDSLPEKQGPNCNPRSLVSTGELLVTMGGNGSIPTDADALETAAAGIGQAAAAQLFATIRLDAELPPMESIIKDPANARVPSAPDAQMLVAYKLAALVTEETIEPVIQYIERLPADFAITFAKALVTRVPMFVANASIIQWYKRNSALMSMMATIK